MTFWDFVASSPWFCFFAFIALLATADSITDSITLALPWRKKQPELPPPPADKEEAD